MKHLDELEKQGIILEIDPNASIDKDMIKKQIESNGSLNDHNIDSLPSFIFSEPPIAINVQVREYDWGKEANLFLRNSKNLYFHLCDFPLAETVQDLDIQTQLGNMHEHMSRKYISSLTLILGQIPFHRYKIERVTESNHPQEVVIARELHKIDYPLNYWNNVVGSMIKKSDFHHSKIYKGLLEFKESLRKGFDLKKEKADEYLPCFVNLSNMMCMVYNDFNSNQINRQKTLEETVFLDYKNLVKIIRNYGRDSLSSKLQSKPSYSS